MKINPVYPICNQHLLDKMGKISRLGEEFLKVYENIVNKRLSLKAKQVVK